VSRGGDLAGGREWRHYSGGGRRHCLNPARCLHRRGLPAVRAERVGGGRVERKIEYLLRYRCDSRARLGERGSVDASNTVEMRARWVHRMIK